MRWLLILTTAGTLLLSPSKITLAQEAQTLTNAHIESRGEHPTFWLSRNTQSYISI